MKSHHQLLTAFIGILFSVSACNLGVTLGTRSMTEVLPTLTVPGAPLPVDLDLSIGLALASPEIDIGSESALVTFVSVRNLTLQILATSELDEIEDGLPDNFDFLTGATVFLRGDFDGTTNQLLIATLPETDPQIGASLRRIELTIDNDNDVFDFLLLPNGYEIVIELDGSIPADSVTLAGEITYRIGLGL